MGDFCHLGIPRSDNYLFALLQVVHNLGASGLLHSSSPPKVSYGSLFYSASASVAASHCLCSLSQAWLVGFGSAGSPCQLFVSAVSFHSSTIPFLC